MKAQSTFGYRHPSDPATDFLFGRPEATSRPPFAIDITRASGKRDETEELSTEDAARKAGYRFERVPFDDAAERGRWWAHALREARDERLDRADRIRGSSVEENGSRVPA